MKRVDLLLVELKLARSRTHAADLIAEGSVFYQGTLVNKASLSLPETASLEDFSVLASALNRFVSRGGLKLEGALEHVGFQVKNLPVLDLGLSTGGFTDCLLQRGVASVVGVDVGRDQIAEKLKNDPRLKIYEGCHVKDLTVDVVGEVALCVVDVSFISLTKVIPYLKAILPLKSHLLALVKPQFEVGKEGLAKGGLVREKELYQQVEKTVKDSAHENGFTVLDYFRSSIEGKDGNVEFFIFAQRI